MKNRNICITSVYISHYRHHAACVQAHDDEQPHRAPRECLRAPRGPQLDHTHLLGRGERGSNSRGGAGVQDKPLQVRGVVAAAIIVARLGASKPHAFVLPTG
jgi:hypothetical protein